MAGAGQELPVTNGSKEAAQAEINRGTVQ